MAVTDATSALRSASRGTGPVTALILTVHCICLVSFYHDRVRRLDVFWSR
jgi:hypothetical protein